MQVAGDNQVGMTNKVTYDSPCFYWLTGVLFLVKCEVAGGGGGSSE